MVGKLVHTWRQLTRATRTQILRLEERGDGILQKCEISVGTK